MLRTHTHILTTAVACVAVKRLEWDYRTCNHAAEDLLSALFKSEGNAKCNQFEMLKSIKGVWTSRAGGGVVGLGGL